MVASFKCSGTLSKVMGVLFCSAKISYKTSPFRSNILVENPSRRIILSGVGKLNANIGKIKIETKNIATTTIKDSFAKKTIRLLFAKLLEVGRKYFLLLSLNNRFHLAIL